MAGVNSGSPGGSEMVGENWLVEEGKAFQAGGTAKAKAWR